jgi:hypothetical protein
MQSNQTYNVSMRVRATPTLSHINVSLVSGVFRIVPGGDRWCNATYEHHVYEELAVVSHLSWAKQGWVQLQAVVGSGLQGALHLRITAGAPGTLWLDDVVVVAA